MGASASTSASKTNITDLKQQATVLKCTLTSHEQLFPKLSQYATATNKYQLCGVLKDIIQPCEIMYFIESMLPMLVNNKDVVDPNNDNVTIARNTTFKSIYKNIIDNADTILQRINKLPNASSTGGKRAARKRAQK